MNSIIAVFLIFIFPAFLLCILVDRSFIHDKCKLRKNVESFLFALYAMIMEVYLIEYVLHPWRIIDFSRIGDNATDSGFIISRTVLCLISALFGALLIRHYNKKHNRSGSQKND